MVALDNQTFHVGALYDSSPGQIERRTEYDRRQVYMLCRSCGHYTQHDGDREFELKSGQRHNISMDGRPVAHPSLFFPPGYEAIAEMPQSPPAARVAI
jgi:hypothetical protein